MANLRENETIELILNRHSTRKFEARPIEDEKIQLLLECAFAAPNSKSVNMCNVVAVSDAATLKKLGELAPSSMPLLTAPLAIGVCVCEAEYHKKLGIQDNTWMEDASAMMMTMLLAARAMGLEGVWMQVLNRPDREGVIRETLSIPDDVILMAMAVVGYPAKPNTRPAHAGVPGDRIHIDNWGKRP